MGKPAEQVAWAKPLEGGPLRVVYIAPRHAWGDARALAERFDARITPIAAPMDASEPAWPEGLRDALADSPEVIILAGFPTAALAPAALEGILSRVSGGAGLVLAHYGEDMAEALTAMLDAAEADEGPEDLLEGSGGGLMPEWRRGLYFAEFASHADGRIAMLDYAGGRPATHALLARSEHPREMLPDHRETWFGMLGRVLLWTAGREPSVGIAALTEPDAGQWDERTVPPELPEEFIQTMREATVAGPTRVYEVALREPASRGMSLAWQLREPARQARLQTPEPMGIAEGAERVAFPVTAVAGAYYLDVWVLHRGRVVDWRTKAVAIEAWPIIQEVAFSHTRVNPHDILGLRVTVPPVTRPARPVTIYARAVDGYTTADGSPRIVAENCVTAEPELGPVQLELSLVDLISPTLRVEIYASEHPCDMIGPATRARSAYAVRNLVVALEREDAFPLVADVPLPLEYGLLEAYSALAAHGVSTAHLGQGPALLGATMRAGLRPMPRLHEEWRVRGIAGGLPDLGASTAVQEAAWWAWQEGSHDAVLESPGLITPHEALERLPGFEQRFLELRGGTGTRGGGMDSEIVDLVVLHLLSDQEALDQIAMRLIEVEDAAPELRLGLAIAPEDAAFLRADWAGIAPGLTFAGTRPERILLRRMAAYLPDTGRAFAYAGLDAASSAETARWAWQARLRGASGVWYRGRAVPGDGARGGVPMLDNAGHPAAALAGLSDGVRDLRDGPGALLAHARPQAAPIVIVDSRASFWLNEVDPLFPGNTIPAQAAWLALLEDLGYPCELVSAEALDAAALENAAAVVLPMCRALSDSAWRALEGFAGRGGVVIADILPATHDGLGGPRNTAGVERLFGVSVRADSGAFAIAPGVGSETSADADPLEAHGLGAELPEVTSLLMVDPAVEAAEARADDGSGTAWLVHPAEEGVRVLLNHPLLFFDPREPDETHARLRDWLAEVLAEAGIAPVVVLRGDDGLPAGTEHAHFEYGSARILALLGPGGTRRPPRVTLDLGEDGHVYEPRTGVRHGNPSRVRVHLEVTHAALLTVLPYRVDSIDLVSPAEVMAGRRLELVARLQARDGLPGRHLFRVEVSTLEGEVLEHYTRHLEASEGLLRTYVPLARNEQPGWYRVTVRDLLSGTAAESRFVVAPRT